MNWFWLDRWWSKVAANRRIDHGPMYVCVTVALLCVSVSLMLVGPVPYSAYSELSALTQDMLALTLFIGSTIALVGVATGTRFFRPRIDPRRAYRLGIAGAPAYAASLAVYGWAIIAGTPSWPSALGGVLGPLIGLGALINAFTFWLEVRRIDHGVAKLIDDNQ